MKLFMQGDTLRQDFNSSLNLNDSPHEYFGFQYSKVSESVNKNIYKIGEPGLCLT